MKTKVFSPRDKLLILSKPQWKNSDLAKLCHHKYSERQICQLKYREKQKALKRDAAKKKNLPEPKLS